MYKDIQYNLLKTDNYHQLKKFLYQAIYVPEGQPPLDPSIVNKPVLQKYYHHFGKINDLAIGAISDGSIVGIVWCRQFKKEDNSYGYYNEDFVELNISIIPEYRGVGIGRQLMQLMIDEVSNHNIKGISLSVSKGNYAKNLYENMGFEVVEVRTEDILMKLELQ